MQPNITIVTAFFDIGRGSWQGPNYLKRTTDQYFTYFERLLKLKNDIIVFTSNDLVHKFDIYHKIHTNLKVIGLEDWRRDIWPEFFEPITDIQNDPIFQNTIHQPWNPEYWSADYVMVNMLKSYFVNYAIDFGFVMNDLAAWIDFGYARQPTDVPTNVWNFNFNPDKIHLFTIKKNCPPFMDLPNIIATNDVWITGCHIVASKKNWKHLLENVYFNLKDLIDRGLIDDDQTVLYMCYCQCPERYEIHKIDPTDWFCIFRTFNDHLLSWDCHFQQEEEIIRRFNNHV